MYDYIDTTIDGFLVGIKPRELSLCRNLNHLCDLVFGIVTQSLSQALVIFLSDWSMRLSNASAIDHNVTLPLVERACAAACVPRTATSNERNLDLLIAKRSSCLHFV